VTSSIYGRINSGMIYSFEKPVLIILFWTTASDTWGCPDILY
jgi:hypothetical protein